MSSLPAFTATLPGQGSNTRHFYLGHRLRWALTVKPLIQEAYRGVASPTGFEPVNPESTVKDTEARIKAILKPEFGNIPLAKLQASAITSWRDKAAKDRKPDTVNRLVNILKAALNRAWKDDRLVADDTAWRMVKRLKGGSARKIFLTAADARTLLSHCEPEAFRRLVQAALLTGARFGELVNLRVHQFDGSTGTLDIAGGKTGARSVYLSNEAVAFFASIAIGRNANTFLLPRTDGAQWGKNHHQRPFDAAVTAAKLPAETTFYALRHTHISLALLVGVNIQVLSENTGTSVRMIEHHYGKFLRADRRAMFDKVKGLVLEGRLPVRSMAAASRFRRATLPTYG